ncbi:TIM barrel protein [Streptomyces erythrochromogenes]|uniref:TIM barrel protein n=1 Tax=Streptomyces erythrochromogenes TaxID=285574 RepID=UPI00363564C3
MTYKQGFAWWSFNEAPHPDPDLLATAAAIGFDGVDFLPREHWARAKDLGLELAVIDGHDPIEVGFNNRDHHKSLSDELRRTIALAVDEDVQNLSVASGDWTGPPHDGIGICAEALGPLAAEAEAAGIGLLLEPLNTKVDHPGHECDSTAWAAAVVEQVHSPALTVLYDTYHMQIMEGDLIRTLRETLPLIGHVHTAGVPGRAELDDWQEVNWKAIATTLADMGFTRYVTHEFTPRGNTATALRQAYGLFDSARKGRES